MPDAFLVAASTRYRIAELLDLEIKEGPSNAVKCFRLRLSRASFDSANPSANWAATWATQNKEPPQINLNELGGFYMLQACPAQRDFKIGCRH
jgi:hypothetical protein